MSIMKRTKNNLARAAMTLLLAVVCAVSYAQTTTIKYTATEKIARFEEIQYFTGATALQSHTFDTGTGEGTVVYAGTVTAFDNYCLQWTSALTGIVIPEGVTRIGYQGFYQCGNLTNLTLPKSLKEIGVPSGQAFAGCTSLKNGQFVIDDVAWWCSLTINGGSNPLSYAKKFYSAPNVQVTSLVIPEGVTSIPHYAFYQCEGITSVSLPSTLTSIGESAFYQCNGLTSVAIPAGAEIGGSAFQRCENLTNVIISEGVTTIGGSAFAYTGLTSLTLPSTIRSMSQSFYGCQDLATLTLTPGITTLSQSFYNCPKLTTLNIPGSVKEIGTSDFSSCTGLTTVVLNEGTEKIEFSGCTNLKTINFPSTTKEIYFKNCSSLETVTLPEGVTRISSFWGCSSLKQINIPKSVTYVGWFRDCSKLEKVIIADVASWCAATHYDAHYYGPTKQAGKLYLGTVDNNEEIVNLVIPEGVTKIRYSSFYGLPNITSVTIPSTLTTWEYNAFCGCTGVTDVWCLANPNTLAWSESENDFAAEKATKMHVCGADVWTTKFPSANATFVEMTALALSEETDNSAILDLKNGSVCDITLKRTLKAGSYNTFAVPFSIPDATLTAKGFTAKRLTASSLANGVLTLNFADATTIEAGKPYFVKVAADVTNPTFEDVTVSNVITPTETTFADFVPSMGKTLVTGSAGHEADAKSVLSLGGANKVFHPTIVNTPDDADSYIKGFRAYFQLKGDAADAPVFNIDFGGDMTGIRNVNENDNENDNVNGNGNWCDLSGRKLSGKPAAKGVYVVNGKKIIVK